MSRPDLLALTADDLSALTNRGTVKRARREVEAGECTADLTETADGSVEAKWSDGAECRIPAGVVLGEAHCTCAAAGLCRHLIRTVFAYQAQAARAAPEQQAPPAEPWDPGTIADDDLAKRFRPAALAKVRAQFEQGVLVELVRGSKPSARFHLQACLLRFLVPGDVRYTHCDCAERAPCSHVPLAVWAFRRLEPGRAAGIIATAAKAPPVPVALLDDLEAAALAFTEYGASGAPRNWLDRLGRLEIACREADLVWPAEVVAEWVQQQERYDSHDARFAPDHVAELVGELLVRCDAIRRDTGALPQLLIRGTSNDRPMMLGAARFVGLGCGMRPGRRSVELTAYLQDSDTGSVVGVSKDFTESDDPARPPRSFADLAQTPAVKRTPFAALGAGQLLIRGGKRTPSFHLLAGRAEVSVEPQSFAWEGLRAPVLVEDFAELAARLSALPPSSLRPRRVAEDFHVLPVSAVESAGFDATAQAVEAVLADAAGRHVLLSHPYTSRGRDGAEALLTKLAAAPEELRFVAGPVRRTATGLVIHPVGVVWQDGAARTVVQPWVERNPESAAAAAHHARTAPGDPLGEYLRRLQEELGELFVLGLQRADAALASRWAELRRQGEATGLARLPARAGVLAEALARKSHTLRWDWRPAGRALLELAALARMAQDLAGA